MRASLRPRSVYDVLSAIACAVVLLGGTAYAAATITGADVVNGSLTTYDLKDGGVYGTDLANDSVTGSDVKESTLNLKPTLTAVAAAATSGDPGATAPTPASGRFCGSNSADTTAWRNYGGGFQAAGFYKDAHGVVHLQGSVSGGQGFGTIFILPGGFRPATTRLFGVFDDSTSGKFGYVKVLPTGHVTYHDLLTSGSSYLSLEGITFRP